MATRKQIEDSYENFDLLLNKTRRALRKLLDTCDVDVKIPDENPFTPLQHVFKITEGLVREPIANAVMAQIREKNWKKIR